MLTFAGFLLLGGRLGDLYGNRRLFLGGLTLFTLASLTCGLAGSQVVLIVARAVQGLGGAVVSAVALSLIMHMFTEVSERAKAMGIFGFVTAGGGSVGVLVGGLLTGSFDWHWIFLVNIPIGVAVFIFCLFLIPKDAVPNSTGRLDVWGAVTVTASLMLAVYAIVGSAGMSQTSVVAMLGGAVLLFLLFLRIESKVDSPLVPLQLFKIRSVAVANTIGILWTAAMFSWFFISALYLQMVLGYTPLQVGLSFLPANLIMMGFSLGLSAKIVTRYGYKLPLSVGMAFIAAGLAYFGLAPEGGTFLVHILPSMVMLGIGAGLGFNPVLMSAMSDVGQSQSGLASGILNTSFMMGGSLGLAILASLAAWRTHSLISLGVTEVAAVLSGYHVAFFAGAGFAALAALVGILFMRPGAPTSPDPAIH